MRRIIWFSFTTFAVGMFIVVWCSIPRETKFVPTRPSTFFHWCENEKFGEISPEGTFLRKADTEYVGELEALRGTTAKTSREAEYYLKKAAKGLVRELTEKGCKVEQPYIGPELVMITYTFESVGGYLEGYMEPAKIDIGDNRTAKWFIHWKLLERPVIR